MLCDPNHEEARLNESILHRRGFGVTVTHSGHLCLDRAYLEPPDLIVAEFQLGDMDANELIAKLRDIPATGSTPVIVMHEGDDEIPDDLPIGAGAVIHARKPIRLSDVMFRVPGF